MDFKSKLNDILSGGIVPLQKLEFAEHSDDNKFRSCVLDCLYDENNNANNAVDALNFETLSLQTGDQVGLQEKVEGYLEDYRALSPTSPPTEEDLDLDGYVSPTPRNVAVFPSALTVTVSDMAQPMDGRRRHVSCQDRLMVTLKTPTDRSSQPPVHSSFSEPKTYPNPRVQKRFQFEDRQGVPLFVPQSPPLTPLPEDEIFPAPPSDITSFLPKPQQMITPASSTVIPKREPRPAKIEAPPPGFNMKVPKPRPVTPPLAARPVSPATPTRAEIPLPRPPPASRSMSEGACICDRKACVVLCEACGFTIKRRVKRTCPRHPGMTYLMDLEVCPKCFSRRLREV